MPTICWILSDSSTFIFGFGVTGVDYLVRAVYEVMKSEILTCRDCGVQARKGTEDVGCRWVEVRDEGKVNAKGRTT